MERANQSICDCVRRGKERAARNDESKEENRCGWGQTQTKHQWNNVNDGGDRDRPQMTEDGANDSEARKGGDITRYRALVARLNYLSQDGPDLRFASMQDGKAISA